MNKYLKIGILLSLVWWAQSALAQDTIPLNTTYSFEVNYEEGYTYTWWFTNDAGVITELESTTNKTEEYYWDTEGEFQIMVQALDVIGCLSDIIYKDYMVADIETDLIVFAGNDTTISSCNPYQLQAIVSNPTGLSYLWKPAHDLDDPTLLNPVFTPGTSTTYTLEVTDTDGQIYTDSVEIIVSEIFADAGDDQSIADGETIVLDGGGSIGRELKYLWTSSYGTIVSGDTTANPVVSSIGTYSLQLTDFYGCTDTDFVSVSTGGAREAELYAIPDFIVGVENLDISGSVQTNDFLFPYDTTTVVYRLVGDDLPGLTFNEDGSFIYQAKPNQTGKFFFGYEVCFKNGVGNCSVAKAEIRILSSEASENKKPIASTDVVLTLLNQAVTANTLVNDANFNNELSISEIPVVPPENGQLQLSTDGTFTYVPDSGFVGIDKFRYQLCNNEEVNLCDSAWVYIYVNTFDSETQPSPLSVYDDLVVFHKDSVYSVAENDFSMDNQALFYNTSPIEDVQNGILQLLPEGTFNYSPNPGFIGVDWFVYEVCNGAKGTSCRTATAFIMVGENEFSWTVDAGTDTIVGSCNPYQLEAWVSDTTGLTYFWEPGDKLNDPSLLNPVFSPGDSTTFILTVTHPSGSTIKDTVTIDVDETYANAGEDLMIERGSTALLDGSSSIGRDIQFLWSTDNGIIDSGENTANPIISNAGTYYLDVRDFYGCSGTDSMTVSWVSYAPIANDDYDTTQFQTAVRIPVLANDEDSDGDLDPTSLEIVQYPGNGSAYINYDDYTVTYTPNNGFVGSDVFEYKICGLSNKCDNAHVYVLVTGVDFLIPEAFTPNGDNINDYFEIKGIEHYPGNSITIINRWGKTLYKAKNYGIDTSPKFWDGKWADGGGNKNVPSGTYFYVLDLGNGQQPIAGSIYIDR